MKSSTLLDSIAFQLTPTRTRCDLVIAANGKTEKIASGLLDPFIAHLKAAQEQIGKGGYSIVLEPNRGTDTPWFTKGTVERFVRFVSTPEILERACTIESEILQIEKAISRQSSNTTGLHNVADTPVKSEERIEGSKPAVGGNEEKAIVLYQPTNHQAEANGPTTPEKNSKVQLVQVLETRKSVLQKEQGMAFARAVAASFDINNIAALLTFAECFGASRMMDACKKFVHLWKVKHESGQWVEVEATEATSFPADVPSTNASGIVLHNTNESSQGEAASETNGKSDHHHQSHQHPMFAPWQMNAQANGMPIFQPYPIQGMPYYHNYPGNNMFQSPYPPPDDPRSYPGKRTRQRRHSASSVDMRAGSETQETDSDEEVSVTRSRRNKGGKSSKNKGGRVVIRNINYIASTKQGSGDSDPQSSSDSGSDGNAGIIKDDETRKVGKKGVSPKSDNPLKSSVGDDGHWQAFQNFLLTDADESSNAVNRMLEIEGKIQGKKRQTAIGDSSSTLGRHNMGGSEDIGFSDRFDISGDTTRVRKRTDDQMDYIFNRQENPTNFGDSSLGPVISNGFDNSANNNNRGSSPAMADESFVVLHRTGSSDQVVGNGRAAMDMDYQLPSVVQKADNRAVSTSPSNYEANDLNLMPNREMEDGLSGYHPDLGYEMQSQVRKNTERSGDDKKIDSSTKPGPKKAVKDQKLKTDRTLTNSRREKPSKSSSLEDARARAEKLRAYKADLQKQKKEKEEEQLKRLEALKIERQKRIAARSGTTVTQSPSSSQQSRKQPLKFSPIKGSKFSDTEPGSSSPLQRSTLKLVPKVMSDSSRTPKAKRPNGASQANGNRLTRSASSLSIRNEEPNCTTSEPKATMSRIRRLSEPKTTAPHVSAGKTQSAEGVPKRRASLPEQKLRASKGSSASVPKKSTNVDMSQKPAEKMISTAPVMSNRKRRNSQSSRNGDDNPIVEKTVVMLECTKPATPVLQQPENRTSVHNMQPHTDKDLGGISEEDTSIPPPASPIIMKEVGSEPSTQEVKGHLYTSANELEEVSPDLPNVGIAEEPYQAPYARVSSTEDRCMVESEYGKALPTSIFEATAGVQNTTVLVTDGQRWDSQAASRKHPRKDSSKGFKRLLMFGKRYSAGSESSIELDTSGSSVAGDNALKGSSSEVFTLKNLLTQDESSSAAIAPKKSSRSFSLLSPFKSKNAEKKATP
ncbi:hypothetical protein vseg_014535 [Gypsophila vaccaria]